MGAPAVGDITGDHGLEVVVTTREGYVYAWSTKGTDTGVVQWESFHHDNQNTGDYAWPLDQGALRVATKVLDCEAVTSTDGGASAVDGGAATSSSHACSCSLAATPRPPVPVAGCGLLGLACALRRRSARRRRDAGRR
jgi:hypothetical protein